MTKVVDLSNAEHAYWSLRFYRATGSAAQSFWLLSIAFLVLALFFSPLLLLLPAEAQAELLEGTPTWEAVGYAVALLVALPLLYAVSVYLVTAATRVHRRLAAVAGMVVVAFGFLFNLLGGLVLPPLLLLGDHLNGGHSVWVVGAIVAAFVINLLQVAVALFLLAALWNLARVDQLSFASARGFVPTLRRPSSVLLHTLGLPFYMSVSGQRERWAPALKFALHNLFASMIAIALYRVVTPGGAPDPEATPETARALAQISAADANWLTSLPVTIVGLLGQGALRGRRYSVRARRRRGFGTAGMVVGPKRATGANSFLRRRACEGLPRADTLSAILSR